MLKKPTTFAQVERERHGCGTNTAGSIKTQQAQTWAFWKKRFGSIDRTKNQVANLLCRLLNPRHRMNHCQRKTVMLNRHTTFAQVATECSGCTHPCRFKQNATGANVGVSVKKIGSFPAKMAGDADGNNHRLIDSCFQAAQKSKTVLLNQ